MADAEKLLIEVKPHLFAISSDYQPAMRSGDAWMTICWTGDGKQLNTDIPSIQYVLGKEGGELWSDYYAIPKGAPHSEAAYALINFMLDPESERTRSAGTWLSRRRQPNQCVAAGGDFE